MLRRLVAPIAALALHAAAARAQVIPIPADQRVGDVPASPGTGVPVRWVRGFFAGFPFHIDDARNLLDGRAVVPAFDTWCGALPYIDFGNRATADSLGRGAPSLLCAPFLDDTQTAPVTCRALPGVPNGRYWQNGGAAMRARGALAVRAAGVYTFAWGHDDGVAFRVGTTPVFVYPDGTAPRVDVAAVRFDAPGLYPFVLEWFDGIGGALLDWYVSPGARAAGEFSNFTFTLVPTADLYPLDESDCTARCEPCALPTPFCDRGAGRCVACRRDADCGPCASCTAGVCRTAAEAPGFDGGPACGPRRVDAGVDVTLSHDAGDATAEVSDIAQDDAAPALLPVTRGGCECAARPGHTRGGLAMGVALVVGWRRRGTRRRARGR